MANTKSLLIHIGLNIEKALQPLLQLNNLFNLFRSSLVATFRTAVVGGFFAVIRAGFQTISGLQNLIVGLTGSMAELQLSAIRTASVVSEGGAGFSTAFEQASNMARTLSTQVNFTAGQIQEGLFTAAQAGYNLNQALGFTDAALKLAATSGENFQGIMNDMIGLSRAFGIGFSKVGQMADAIAGASQKSKVSVAGLFEGLKNVASVANVTFGESQDTFTDMTAALMTLNDAGVENSTAGVKLRASLQQLNSGTAKTTATFAKYGINIFKSTSENQRFVTTLMKSQKAFTDYDEKLNKLKDRQLDLVNSGRQGSAEYKNTTDQIDTLTGQIGILEQGMERVEAQFRLAGGELKPFHELLGELKQAPKESILRAFGIRGGEAISRLLQNPEFFEKNRNAVQKFMAASESGQSILSNVYEKFFTSVLVRWEVLKNTVLGIFSVIADAAFSAFGPLFEPLEVGLKELFNTIQSNKASFTQIFSSISGAMLPVFGQVGKNLQQISEQWQNIFTPGAAVSLPVAKFDKKTGEIQFKQTTVDGTEGVAKKMELAITSAFSVFRAGLAQIFETVLSPLMAKLAAPFAEALSSVLLAKAAIFIEIGRLVAQGFIMAVKEGISQVSSKATFGAVGTGIGGAVGAGIGSVAGPLGMGAAGVVGAGLGGVVGSGAGKFIDWMKGKTSSKTRPINLEFMNKAVAAIDSMDYNIDVGSTNLVNGLLNVGRAAGRMKDKSQKIQRDNSQKALKGI